MLLKQQYKALKKMLDVLPETRQHLVECISWHSVITGEQQGHQFLHTEPQLVFSTSFALFTSNDHSTLHNYYYNHFTAPWILSRTTQVSRYQKGKTNLDLLEQETVSGSGISWAICKSAPHPRQATTPACITQFFYSPDALPAAQPTVSKHWRQSKHWRHSP